MPVLHLETVHQEPKGKALIRGIKIMRQKEFGKMLTTQTGINVIQIIFDNGMNYLKDNPIPNGLTIEKTKEWKIAKELVEKQVTPDNLFYYLCICESIARELVKKDGIVLATDLPHLDLSEDMDIDD